MTFKPFNTLDEMLVHVKDAMPLDKTHPEQKNAKLNQFKYKKYTSPQNQTIIVKLFNESSYNGPTTHDFIERLNIVFDSVKKTINKDQLAQLQKEKQMTLDKINETCKIAPIKNVDELQSKENDLIKIINKGWHLLQAFMSKAVLIINPDALKNDSKLGEILATIATTESTITAARGRPNFVNYYPVPYKNTTTDRVSINRVIGHAIPSTERKGYRLPNFVEFGAGYMENNQYIAQFKGYRHSSYTPIKMIDKKYGDSNYHLIFSDRKKLLTSINKIKFERRKAAALCAKDMFAELARQKIIKGANAEQTIELNLSSLAMLSPIKGDKAFMRRGESEHRQLKESYDALMMYNGHEIKINVDGKTVTVKPVINLMNVASNWHGVLISKYMPSTLEKNINAEGMNKYITETEKYLKLDYLGDNSTIKKLHQNQTVFKNQLSDHYKSLDKYLNKKTNASTDPDYIQLLDSINKTRSKIYNIEHQILNERINMLKKNRSEIQSFVKGILDKEKGKSSKDEIAELFYQSLFMYMDKKIEPTQFGARYLLVNEKMGNAVDFYCKSGEDRTGRMQNFIEELCEFSKEQGYFPRYDFSKKNINKDDETIHRNIAKIVSERSVSRDNTDANTRGARGLQITSSMELNTGLPNRSGRKMGTLARGVYDSVAIKKLLRAIRPLAPIITKIVASGPNVIKRTMADFVQPMKKRIKLMKTSDAVPVNEDSASQHKPKPTPSRTP